MKSEKSKKTAKDYYVDPNEMWGEIDDFYKKVAKSKKPEDEEMSPRLGKMIDDIATKLGYMMKFINYSYKEEMIGDARLKMVKAVYDRNFSLWKTSFCTPLLNEGGRDFVIQFLENIKRHEWDDKKTYLKDWDTFSSINHTAEVVDPLDKTNLVKIFLENGKEIKHTITVRNNPFSYFTKVAYHAFVNRIKKEKKVADGLKSYQEKVYEDQYSSGNGWENVRRQVTIDDEENSHYDESLEEFFDEDKEVKEKEKES